MLLQAVQMLRSWIAFVLVESVLWKYLVQGVHVSIPCNLGEYGGC